MIVCLLLIMLKNGCAVEQSLEVEDVYAEEMAKWLKAVKDQGHCWEFYTQPCYHPSKNPKAPQK